MRLLPCLHAPLPCPPPPPPLLLSHSRHVCLHLRPFPCSNMLVAYNALLHFLGSTGALQRSLSVYRGMRRHGPRPDVVTYNTLMAGAAAGGGNVRTALRIFSDMVDAGTHALLAGPECVLRCALPPWQEPARRHTSCSCAATTASIRLACRMLSGCSHHVMHAPPLPPILSSDIEPTERTCGALLNCYAKARDAASARKVFDSLAQLGIRPNTQIYTSLIDACVQTGGRQWLEVRVRAGRRLGSRPRACTAAPLTLPAEAFLRSSLLAPAAGLRVFRGHARRGAAPLCRHLRLPHGCLRAQPRRQPRV